jgi:hypothetical protein
MVPSRLGAEKGASEEPFPREAGAWTFVGCLLRAAAGAQGRAQNEASHHLVAPAAGAQRAAALGKARRDEIIVAPEHSWLP